MGRLNEKQFKILSILLLSEKPLTTAEIAALTHYPRTTLDPYMLKFFVNGYCLDEGNDRVRRWIINEKRRPEILKAVMTFSDAIETNRKEIAQKYNKNRQWVHLIDADCRYPNVALMKLATFHKSRGDRVTMSRGDKVGFCRNAPDKIYVSIIFKKNAHMFNDLASYYPDTEIDIGGSGYRLQYFTNWIRKSSIPITISNI